jgi:aspartyl-tRNA(Asn)/glutamyl-tRNA(Gln) amidotransferase subunit A
MRTLGLPEVLTFEVAKFSSKLRAREISSVEATEAYLDWISERDGQLGSYITVTQERARADAARADREIGAGNGRGPFHGVPLGLKGNLYTKGVLTTGGSKVLADFRPDFDATAWAKLASQGAVLLGKLNLNEFAHGGLLKMCRNPYESRAVSGRFEWGPRRRWLLGCVPPPSALTPRAQSEYRRRNADASGSSQPMAA